MRKILQVLVLVLITAAAVYAATVFSHSDTTRCNNEWEVGVEPHLAANEKDSNTLR